MHNYFDILISGGLVGGGVKSLPNGLKFFS